MNIYVGTYTSGESKGIYKVCFDDGILHDPSLYCGMGDPKYLCRQGDRIVSIFGNEEGAGVALIGEGKIIDRCYYEKVTSCYVTSRNNIIYTANYHEGTFSVIETEGDRLRHLSTIKIKGSCGCHQVLFHGDDLLIPCLFLDRIMVYDKGLKKKNEIVFPAGSGPRHGVFDRDGRYLYVLGELDTHLYKVDMETSAIVDDLLLYAQDLKDGAAIRMNDGMIYCSSRLKDEIIIISASEGKVLQHVSCGGMHPRDFIIIDGHLICANRFSNELVSMRIREDGTLGEIESRTAVPEGVALVI